MTVVYYRNKLVGEYTADAFVVVEVVVELKTIKEIDLIHFI